MNWLAIIVVTTNLNCVQYVERIPVTSSAACEVAVTRWEEDYVSRDLAPASYFYECVNIGSIVKGAK